MGGMLTNFSTVKKRIERLQELRKMQQEGQFEAMSKKDAKRLQDELDRLMFHFDGIADMRRLPGALYVVDPRKEHIAVTEANRLKIPLVAITDSTCDPALTTFQTRCGSRSATSTRPRRRRMENRSRSSRRSSRVRSRPSSRRRAFSSS